MKRQIFWVLAVLMMTGTSWAQRGLSYHEIQVKDELNRPVTDITSATIYTSGTSSAATIYMDTLLANAITQPITTESTNTTLDQGKGTIYWYGVSGYDITVTSTAFGTITARGYNASNSMLILPTYLPQLSETSYGDANSISMGGDDDWVLNAGATAGRLTATPAVDDSDFRIGSTTYTSDLKLFGGTSDYDLYWDASENTLEFLDNAVLAIGTGDDLTISHNGTTTTITGAYTQSGTVTISASDVLFDDTYDIHWDTSEDTLGFLDNAVLGFGNTASSPDVEFKWDADSFNMTAGGTDYAWEIGGTAAGFDITYAFETAGQFRTDYDGDFVNLTDDMELRLGTGASADGDFKISSNSSNVLQIEQVVADTGTITVGADGAGMDVTFYGEEAGDYLKWDGTGASKLLLNGANSSGTLFGITGIDTTGNTDTMTIAHSGTGDGLQITATEADSVALNLVAATSQTTSLAKVDGATGSWLGAANVGMLHLTNDGALADVASSLLYIANSGVPTNDSRGSSLRIVDTGNAAAGTAGYAAYISATDATVEALMIDDGNVLIDEDLDVGGVITTDGINASVVLVTDAGTYAVLAANTGMVHVIPDAGQGITISLPVEAAGLNYKFIYGGAAADASNHIITSGSDTNFFYGGVAFIDVDAGEAADELSVVYSNGSSNSKLTINVIAAGTYVEFFCDGTHWYVNGTIISATAPTIAGQ